jgi:hypothetical protein
MSAVPARHDSYCYFANRCCRMGKISVPDLGLRTVYHEFFFGGGGSSAPGKFRANISSKAMAASFHILSDSLISNATVRRCDLVSATNKIVQLTTKMKNTVLWD